MPTAFTKEIDATIAQMKSQSNFGYTKDVRSPFLGVTTQEEQPDPFYAAGQSLGETAKAFVGGSFNVGTGIAETMMGIKSGDIERTSNAILKTLGSAWEAGTAYTFAIPSAAFSFVKNIPSIKDSPFAEIVDNSLLMLRESLTTPSNYGEREDRKQYFAGRMGAKIREGLGAPETTGQMSPFWQKAFDGVLNQALGTLADITTFKAIEGGAKGGFRGTIEGFKEGGVKGAIKGGIKEGFKGAVSEVVDAKLYKQRFANTVSAVKRGLQYQPKTFISGERLWRAADEVRKGTSDVYADQEAVNAWKEYLNVRDSGTAKINEMFKKGRKINDGDKLFITDWFARIFKRAPREEMPPEVYSLVNDIKHSDNKIEHYPRVATEIVTSLLSNKGFIDFFAKAGSFEDLGKFSQLKGMEKLKQEKEIRDRESKIMQVYKEAGKDEEIPEFFKVDRVLSEIYAEMDVSQAGQRIWNPEWIPEELRNKKLFNAVMAGLQVDNIKFPEGNRSKQRYLYDLILNEADKRLGVDTKEARYSITNLYEPTRKTEIADGVSGGITRRKGITGEGRDETVGDIAPKAEILYPNKRDKGKVNGMRPEEKEFVNGVATEIKDEEVPIPQEEVTKYKDDKVIGDAFKSDRFAPLTIFDEIKSPVKVIDEKIVKGGGERIDRANDTMLRNVGEVEIMLKKAQESAWEKYGKPTAKLGSMEFLTDEAKLKFIQERSDRIGEAIEDHSKIPSLSKEDQESVVSAIKFFNNKRLELLPHLAKLEKYYKKIVDADTEKLTSTLDWLERNEDASPVVKRQVKAESEVLKERVRYNDAKRKEKQDEQRRLAKPNPNYFPHVIDEVMRAFVEEQFPEMMNPIDRAVRFQDNNFLKERKDFQFFKKDSDGAIIAYAIAAEKQLQLDFPVENILREARDNGFHEKTVKGKYLKNFINHNVHGMPLNSAWVQPSFKILYDSIYKLASVGDAIAAKKFKVEDQELITKLLEKRVVLTKEQADYIREHAVHKETVKMDGDVLILRTLQADDASMDRVVSNMKTMSYLGTIALQAKVTVVNMTTQPLASLAYSGLEGKEAFNALSDGMKLAWKAMAQNEEGEAMREQLQQKGYLPKKNDFINPENPFSAVRSKFVKWGLVNMEYSEIFARVVTGVIGERAGKGDIIEVNGVKLSREWSNMWNYKMSRLHLPTWALSPGGRMFTHLQTYGMKTAERFAAVYKSADFKDFAEKARKIYQEDIPAEEKYKRIWEEYKKNSFRIGIPKHIMTGLISAMILGQIFDLDWDEFLTKGIGFGVSNPITNLVLGAGGFDSGIIQNAKSFIPFRGAVRSIDKTLGLDILSNYKDYGSVPKILK